MSIQQARPSELRKLQDDPIGDYDPNDAHPCFNGECEHCFGPDPIWLEYYRNAV